MRREREPLPRVKEAWVWIGGTMVLGLLFAGVAAAAVALWENIDVRQLTPGLVVADGPLPEPDLAGPASAPTGTFQAVIFDSDRNRDYFPEVTYYDREMAQWEEVITAVGGQIRRVTNFDQLGMLGTDEILVLIESPCLSPAELAAVREHLAAGGSIVANWAVGVRDADCEWRGWGTLLELTGAEEVQEIGQRSGLFVTVPDGIPLATGMDPGTRIELRPDPSLALRMEGPRAYWSDWALNPEPDENGFGTDVAATARSTEFGGRTAWFGMRLGQAATPSDSTKLRRLAENGVRWARGEPYATVSAWPGALRAAMVLTLDVEDQAQNAGPVADLLRQSLLPGTFFAVTQIAAEDAELATVLTAAGEVGSQTVDHTPLAGLTPQDQAIRLRRSRSDVEAWTGLAPAGLRPPEEAFDTRTLTAWRSVGGEYLVARNGSRSASPEIHQTAGGPVVLLPRLIKDDYNVIVQDRAFRSERIGEAFVQGSRKIYAIGGLAVIAGHTQIMDSEARRAAYTTVADSARVDGGWWMATGRDVARWWRSRAETELAFVPAASRPPGNLAVEPSGLPDLLVTAASEPMTGVWIEVTLPRGTGGLVPLVDGIAVDFAETGWGLRIPVGSLQPDAQRRISLVVASEANAQDPQRP